MWGMGLKLLRLWRLLRSPQLVAICALVAAGLALCWGVLALALIATLKALAKTDHRTCIIQANETKEIDFTLK
jgi:hypothetical protein